MFRRRPRINLHRTSIARLIPVFVALCLCLLFFSLSTVVFINQLTEKWSFDTQLTWTIQVPKMASAVQDEQQLEKVYAILHKIPAIRTIKAMTQQDIYNLLQPWLNSKELIDVLPIPHVLSVSISPKSNLSSQAIAQQLYEVSPEIFVDNHRQWYQKAARIFDNLTWISVGIFVLTIGISVIIIVSITVTTIKLNRNDLHLLQLMGGYNRDLIYLVAQQINRLVYMGLMLGTLVWAPFVVFFWLWYRDGLTFFNTPVIIGQAGLILIFLIPVISLLACIKLTVYVTTLRLINR